MTEAQVWRMAAEKLDDGQEFSGICYAKSRVLHSLNMSGKLSDRKYRPMFRAMDNRIREHMAVHTKGVYAYLPGTEREARILAALWMALEAEEEE